MARLPQFTLRETAAFVFATAIVSLFVSWWTPFGIWLAALTAAATTLAASLVRKSSTGRDLSALVIAAVCVLFIMDFGSHVHYSGTAYLHIQLVVLSSDVGRPIGNANVSVGAFDITTNEQMTDRAGVAKLRTPFRWSGASSPLGIAHPPVTRGVMDDFRLVVQAKGFRMKKLSKNDFALPDGWDPTVDQFLPKAIVRLEVK